MAPLADLDDDNVAAIYMLPDAGVGPFGAGTAGLAGTPDVTAAEASGLDLPVGGPSDIGGGGDSPGVIGVPPGLGGGGGGGGTGGGGGGGGGTGGGGGGGGGGTGGGGGGGGVHGVPEPATWALMLIGVGAIGGLRRRDRRIPVTA